MICDGSTEPSNGSSTVATLNACAGRLRINMVCRHKFRSFIKAISVTVCCVALTMCYCSLHLLGQAQRLRCHSAEIECRPQLLLGEGDGFSAAVFALVDVVLYGYLVWECMSCMFRMKLDYFHIDK